jgi:predicted flap endonuclease-1-like 5' DNA nuclease
MKGATPTTAAARPVAFGRSLTATSQAPEALGVDTIEELLETGGTPAGREAIADKSGLSPKLILEWVNHADLMRVKGVGSEYADLLEAAGVDTVAELAQRNAANLAATLGEVNEAKNLVRRVPTETEVTGWIAEAKTLPKAVQY